MDTQNRRDSLSDTKRALLEARLRGAARAPRQREVITRVAGDGPEFPMSWGQERMWFLAQVEPDNPMYNVPITITVRADLDVALLERALAMVVRRHEALRTVFRMVDGELRQIVMEPFQPKVEVFDVRGRLAAAGGDVRDEVLRLAAEEGARLFDVGRLPLFRVTLLRISDERYAQVTTVHHIATDGWSYPLILREMDQFYADLARGRPHTLPEPKLRFVDYAVWQRAWLTGETLERQVAYWREHLRGAPPLALPTDRPRPPVQSYRGTFHHFPIGRELTRALHDLGRREAATLNMVMTAAFAALLARWAGQDDVVVGTLLGNRSHTEIEEIIGFFVNTAALRVRLDGDPSFSEVVQRTKRVILGADQNQDLPFEKLVDELGMQRDPSRHPLFQAMYFHHAYVLSHESPEDGFQTLLDPQPLHRDTEISLIDTGVSKFDLMMCTVETDGVLNTLIEYATDLFDAATIHRFARHLAAFLRNAAAAPGTPLSRISLLDAGERERLLGVWASADPAPSAEPSVHAAFAARAAATPGATAIVHAGGTVTYAELDARSTRIAHRLRALGVRPGARVAVAVERSAGLVAALLGALKAGASYLPLDPEYPAARLAFVLGDAGAAALVVADEVPGALAGFGGPVLSLAGDAEAIGAEPSDPLAETVDAEAEAYVVYTSGSTGTPKGVAVPHRAVLRLVRGAEYARFAPDEVFLHLAPAAFDASTFEVWGALLNGASLAVHPPHLPAPAELGEFIRAHGVTTAWLTAGLFNQVVDAGPAHLRGLRTLLVGGDVVSAAHVARAMAALPELAVINGYGPTENTTFTTTHRIGRDQAEAGAIPIGRPVRGTRVYVLDAAMEPCAIGVPGELWTGGAGLAHGYLARPALTAERFRPDPFSAAPGARLYRTGDRARWIENGTIEFLGRMDEQVKVRGFRIEPGEVEAALAAHPAVRSAAVVARDDGRGRQLVAYVVALDGGAAPEAAELRAHLRSLVPEYLVPAAFVSIDALPLTANGKVDRAALPAPSADAPISAGDGAQGEPANEVEAALARIWAQVLGRERVGVHDNFFELGGDSILSIQVIVRATEEGIRVTPRQIFQHQTVAGLAAVAGTAPAVSADQGVVTGDVPLTPVQHWFFDGDAPGLHHWNMPAIVRAAERMDAAVLARAAAAVAAHHDALRLRFDRGATGWREWNADATDAPPLGLADLSSVPDAALPAAIDAAADEAERGLDLARTLFRVLLIDCGPSRPQRVLIVAHHLVMDAVSLPLVLADLETAYRQLAAGEAVHLPAKTTAFRDWARRLADHAGASELRVEAEWWRSAIPRDVPPFPADDASAPDTEADAEIVSVELTAEETAALREAGARLGAQMPELLLAALARAVERWSGAARLLVDVEAHGREELFADVDLSRTVGWFTAIHPVHLSLEGHGSPAEAVRAVADTLRAVPNRGIGFGVLRWLSLEPRVRAGLRSLPRAQVSFNYLGQMDGGGAASAGALLLPADDGVGVHRAPAAPRRHRLAVDGGVWDGRLHLSLVHGRRVYRRATIERLAAEYGRALREIIADSPAVEASDALLAADAVDAGLAAEAVAG